MDPLHFFLSETEADPRITTAHISLYVSLWKKWKNSGAEQPLYVFRQDVMNLCKISSYNTYHKVIRQLHQYGYIRYIPSYNHFAGSSVYFMVSRTEGKVTFS